MWMTGFPFLMLEIAVVALLWFTHLPHYRMAQHQKTRCFQKRHTVCGVETSKPGPQLDGEAMTAIAIIPARGGSKGIPHKNMAPVAGLSLIERSILACRQSERIDRVVVTSDSQEILWVAQHAGAETIQRPAELATDQSPTRPAIEHAIKAGGLWADYLALVQCTSPFLTGGHADRCFEALDRWPAAQVAILAAQLHTVIWQGGQRQHCLSQPDGILRGRRQDQAPMYLETGACYVYRWDSWEAHGDTIRAANTVLVGVPFWPYSVQVDTPDDLRAADMLAREWGLW